MAEPENLVLKLLREVRGEIGEMRDEMATKKDVAELKGEIADVRSDVKTLASNVASDLLDVEKRLSDRINHLNRAVIEYHSSTIGHGSLITEFEQRLRRVESHLNLPPLESH
jgi:NTP pyrophosphatase (non-canonical NTP hydrolase)